MASLDEVISAIAANSEAATEVQGQIEGTKSITEETLGQTQALSIEGAAAAVGVCKDQLEEASALAAALANKLNEARASAEAAKQG